MCKSCEVELASASLTSVEVKGLEFKLEGSTFLKSARGSLLGVLKQILVVLYSNLLIIKRGNEHRKMSDIVVIT